MSRKKLPEFTSNGRFVAYVRVSTGRQLISGLGVQAQKDTCVNKGWELGLKLRTDCGHSGKAGIHKLNGFYLDGGESAFKKTLQERISGEKLFADLQPGDTVITARMDRMFRNVADFIQTSNILIERGVRLVVCNPPIDLGTATGRMLARHLANLAEWESDRKGERIRDALAQKRELLKQRESECTLVDELDTDTGVAANKKLKSLPSEWRPLSHVAKIIGQDVTASSDPAAPPARVFIYVRCSHRDSAESGLGMLAQLDQARSFADRLIEKNPHLELSEIFVDEAVSATKLPLRVRQAGHALDLELKRGDHIVFSTIDRGFRSIADMAATLPDWIARGVEIHFALDGLTMSDPSGRMMANVVCMFAQFEAELTSARTKEARSQLAAKGKFTGGREPAFWKIYRSDGTKRLVLDKQRIVAFRLVNLLRHLGKTKKEALIRCEELIAARFKRPALPLSGVNPSSKLSGMLPEGYERDKNGRAYPMFTVDRYDTAVPSYEEAMKQWRVVAERRRQLRDSLGPMPEGSIGDGLARKPNGKLMKTGRKWLVGMNPNNDDRQKADAANCES